MPWHFNNWNNWYNWYNFSNTYLNPAPDSASTTEDSNTSFNVLSNDSSSSSKFVTHVNGATIAIGDVIVLSGGASWYTTDPVISPLKQATATIGLLKASPRPKRFNIQFKIHKGWSASRQ